MAAIILALKRNRKSREDAEQGRAFDSTISAIDANRDGIISHSEMSAALPHVSVNCHTMLDRLTLEKDLTQMLIKLPNFCVCVICFLIALVELVPSADISNIHRQIKKQFNLDAARSIGSLGDIYDYALDFEHKNEELQATSAKYWCEHRYAQHLWDDHYLVPHWECPSPRQFALHYSEDPSHSWTNVCGAGSTRRRARRLQGDGAAEESPASGPEPRRLASLSGSSQATHCQGAPANSTRRLAGASSSSHGHGIRPPCEDDDAGLAIEENQVGYTCAGHADHVCGIDIGLKYCRYTCGYCAPFEYDHTHIYVKPLVTMMPVMLHQKRYQKAPCHGFAEVYENQPYNEALYILPALDGRRKARVLTCIDRKKFHEEDYALIVPCPQGSPINHCYCPNSTHRDGIDSVTCPHRFMYHTKKHTFHGETVYPVLLTEAQRDITAMKQIDWLDLQTAEAVLSTLIYTEGLEIFTSLTVAFKIDNAGNVKADIKLLSYRDLIDEARSTFIGLIVVTMIGAALGVGLSIWYLLMHPGECHWGYALYELFSRLLLFCYPLALTVSWSLQHAMSHEFDKILHSFLDMESVSEHDVEEALDHYYEVKTEIYEETAWLKRHRITAYLVIYVQFMQLIFYMNAHPKMAVLTATLWRAFDNLLHFLMLFSMLFLMMAYMAHWMLGGDIEAFKTYGDAISAQGRMIYGEFIYASGADDLDDTILAMYWLYAFTWMLMMFFTLLNFFLAIVVDAFADVKSDFEAKAALSNFIVDTCYTIYSRIRAWRERWPACKDLISFFEEHQCAGRDSTWLDGLEHEDGEEEDETKVRVTIEALAKAFPEHFSYNEEDKGKHRALTCFVLHYFLACRNVLCRRGNKKNQVDEDAEQRPFSPDPGAEEPNATLKEARKPASEHMAAPAPPTVSRVPPAHSQEDSQAKTVSEESRTVKGSEPDSEAVEILPPMQVSEQGPALPGVTDLPQLPQLTRNNDD